MPINSTGTCAHILSKAYRNSYANSIETFHEIRGKIFFSWLIEVWKLNVFKCAYYSFSSLSARLINVQAPLVFQVLRILLMVLTIGIRQHLNCVENLGLPMAMDISLGYLSKEIHRFSYSWDILGTQGKIVLLNSKNYFGKSH